MVTAMGSLFTCLQGSQPSEWVSGTLLLGLVSEGPGLWNSAAPGPAHPLLAGMGLPFPSVSQAFQSSTAVSLQEEQCQWLFLSGVYCCCINLHLKSTIKCF